MGVELYKSEADLIGVVPKKQIEWLKNDLSKTNNPTIVFVHHSVADDNMKGNFWFEEKPESGLLENFNNNGIPAEAYTVVELEKNKIRVKVEGNDPADYKYNW